MILMIDWGNTYLKYIEIEALSIAEVESADLKQVETVSQLGELLNNNYQSIRVASVRSDKDNQQLETLIKSRTSDYSFAKTARQACGIQCGYDEVESLGIDRWLGILAAGADAKVAIISIGTAITLDVLIDSKHLGGQIIPGSRLLNEILLTTGKVRSKNNVDIKKNFGLGKSTTQSVEFGINSLVFSYLKHVIHEVKDKHAIENVILTGGGGQYWVEILSKNSANIELRSKLVFEGLVRLYSE